MSQESQEFEPCELAAENVVSTTTSGLITSCSTRPANAFQRLPQETWDKIQDFLNVGHGQLLRDFRTPNFVLATIICPLLHERALCHYWRTNAHVRMKARGILFNKAKDEVERIRNLHVTWEDNIFSSDDDPRFNFFTPGHRPDVKSIIESIIINFQRYLPSRGKLILNFIQDHPKLRRLGIKVCIFHRNGGSHREYRTRIQWLLVDLTTAFEMVRIPVIFKQSIAADGAVLYTWEADDGEVLGDGRRW